MLITAAKLTAIEVLLLTNYLNNKIFNAYLKLDLKTQQTNKDFIKSDIIVVLVNEPKAFLI